MILPNNRNNFVINSNVFLNKFVNKKDIDYKEMRYLQNIVYDKFNANDPLVQNFFTVFSQLCYEIVNNNTIKNAFSISDNLPNYKNQKIVQAYNNTIYPYHRVINDFIIASVYGSATYIKKVIELCSSTNKNYDYSFMNELINMFDTLDADMLSNAINNKETYYPIDFEINEYKHLNDPNYTSQRYNEFVKELKSSYLPDDPDIDFIDEKNQYRKKLTGRIGELLVVNKLQNKPYFIHSAKDVGNFTGFDASFYENKEYLCEIKSTFENVNNETDIIFVGSTEKRRIARYLKNNDNTNENYVLIRVFINENYKIEYELFLKPIDEYTFIDQYHNIYEQDPNYNNAFKRKKMINKC